MNIPKTNQSNIQSGTAQNQNNAVLKNEKLLTDFFLFPYPSSKGFSREQLGQNVASSINILSQFRHCGIFNPATYYKSK